MFVLHTRVQFLQVYRQIESRNCPASCFAGIIASFFGISSIFGIFSVRGYLPLIRKDSSTHGLAVYLKKDFLFHDRYL